MRAAEDFRWLGIIPPFSRVSWRRDGRFFHLRGGERKAERKGSSIFFLFGGQGGKESPRLHFFATLFLCFLGCRKGLQGTTSLPIAAKGGGGDSREWGENEVEEKSTEKEKVEKGFGDLSVNKLLSVVEVSCRRSAM